LEISEINFALINQITRAILSQKGVSAFHLVVIWVWFAANGKDWKPNKNWWWRRDHK